MSPSPDLNLHTESVRPEWIDYNGHMNVAYYLLAFDHATDALLEYVGLGQAYLKACHRSVFVLEGHITYDQEVGQGDRLRFETRLLDVDHKRLHLFHRMFHADQGYLAATHELLAMHINMDSRRSEPMPDTARQALERIWEHHRHLPRPEQAGRVIGIRR